jgi:hypothetical protein
MHTPSTLPVVRFDPELGKRFSFVDLDIPLVASRLAVADTSILVSAETKYSEETDRLKLGAASYRSLTIYLGSCLEATLQVPRSDANAVISGLASQSIVHELEHVEQYEAGTVPLINDPATQLPWAQRPWEIEAIEAGRAYYESLQAGQEDFLFYIAIRETMNA